MNHRPAYREHTPIRGSLARHVGEPVMGESKLRALAAKALQAGVLVFVRADLARLPWHEQRVIEQAARRLYG